MTQIHSVANALKADLTNLCFEHVTDNALKLHTIWKPTRREIFRNLETIEQALMISEAYFYKGLYEKAHDLLLPFLQNEKKFLDSTRALSVRRRLQIGECYYSQRKLSQDSLPSAVHFAEQLLDTLGHGNTYEKGEIYYFLMRVRHRQGNYDGIDGMSTFAMKAIESITQSDTQGMHTPNVRWMLSRILLVSGIAAWRHLASDQAAARLELARWLLGNIDDRRTRARINHSLGALACARDPLDYGGNAKRLLDDAYEDYRRLEHPLDLSRIHCTRGRYWFGRKEFDEASKELDNAKKYAIDYKSPMMQAEVLVWDGWLVCSKTESSRSHIDTVIELGHQALRYLEKTQAYDIAADANLLIGHCYLQNEGSAQAEAHFRKALTIAQKHRLQKHAVNALLSLSETYRDRSDAREAKIYYDRATNVFPNGTFLFSKFLEGKRGALEKWLTANDRHVFLRTKEDVLRGKMTFKDYRDQYDAWVLKQVYEAEGLQLQETAERLNISRQRLTKMMKTLNVRTPRTYATKPKQGKEVQASMPADGPEHTGGRA